MKVIYPVTYLHHYLEETCVTIRTDHEAHQCILVMAEAPGKLARLCLRLSEFEFDIFQRARIKYHAAEVLSCLKINDEDKTLLDDEVPDLTISQECFASPPMTETTDLELIEEPNGPFVRFILNV